MKIAGLPFLTFRTDSLLVKCCVAAAIWYLPQDIAALGGAAWLQRQRSKMIGSQKTLGDVENGWKNFLEKKNVDEQQFVVKRQQGGLWVASFR